MSNEFEGQKSSTIKVDTALSQSPGRNVIEESPSKVKDRSASINQMPNATEYENVKKDLDDVIHGLDEKLNRVLAKQEYEYLKGYNLYVKRKEKELRDLILRLEEKNSNNNLKDEKIINLEKTIRSIRDDQIRQEKQKEDLSKEIKKWKNRSNNME